MAAPLYYLPGLHAADIRRADGQLRREQFARLGLTHVTCDVRDVRAEMSLNDLTGIGPDGKTSGLIFAVLRKDKDILGARGTRYAPQFQTWHDCGPFWIGLDNEQPPGADDLARPLEHAGYRVTLGDGAEYCIAIARRPDGTSELPRSLGWDAEGNYTERVKADYRQLWDDAGRAIEWFHDGFKNANENAAEILDVAVRAVGINYRYGRAEQNVLGLIDSNNWATVLFCLIDAIKIATAAEQKKTDPSGTPDGMNSSPGHADSVPATDPAAANST